MNRDDKTSIVLGTIVLALTALVAAAQPQVQSFSNKVAPLPPGALASATPVDSGPAQVQLVTAGMAMTYHAWYSEVLPGPDGVLGTADDVWGGWLHASSPDSVIDLPGTETGSWEIIYGVDTVFSPAQPPPARLGGELVHPR